LPAPFFLDIFDFQIDFPQDGPRYRHCNTAQPHKQLHAVEMADILKAAFLVQIGGKAAPFEYHVPNAVARKLRKLLLYRFYGQAVEHTALVVHTEAL